MLDAEANAVWVHRGRALGDYPPLERVLVEVGSLAKQAKDPKA
ncbi:MAG: hypothetical protein WD404_07800 [Solirubrobacterales bacterium]